MSKNTDLGSLVNYIKGQVTGRLNAPAYTSATAFTGTIAGYLGFDTSGNILTSGAVGLSGSGTTNFISKWTGSTALGNSLIYDDGTNVGLNNTSPVAKFHVTGNTVSGLFTGNSALANGYSGILVSARDAQDAGGTYCVEIRATNMNSTPNYINPRMDFLVQNNNTYLAADRGLKMSIYGSGNVSIGNTNNTYKLDVTGDVNISGTYRVNGTAIGSGVTGSGSTNLMPLWTSTTGLGNSIIYNNAGNLGINSTTDGYTLNAIRSASTTFNESYKGTGSTIQVMSRFMQDESVKKGIAIGYNTTYDYSGIYGTQISGNLRIGVFSGSSFKAMIVLSSTGVSMDLPTSGGGLGSGQLYNDGGTVKIIT